MSGCPTISESGGYTVHPVPIPLLTSALKHSNLNLGGSSQNLMLLSRGNAISGAPIIKGTNQFPNPPIKIGITVKKIITNAWLVTITLYACLLPKRGPLCLSSSRIKILIAVPVSPHPAPKIKYRVPISLWLVENNQRVIKLQDHPAGDIDSCR